MLTLRDINAIAQALTPALLEPYVPPARPFVLGTPARHGVRPGYTARTSVEAGTTPPARVSVARIAAAIASALHSDVGTASGIAVSDGELERSADPAARVHAWRTARVVVVATALRRFTLDGDDEGPPADPSCYRQWTLPELQAWLDASGFESLFGGTLPGATGDHAVGVLIISAQTPAAHASALISGSPISGSSISGSSISPATR